MTQGLPSILRGRRSTIHVALRNKSVPNISNLSGWWWSDWLRRNCWKPPRESAGILFFADMTQGRDEGSEDSSISLACWSSQKILLMLMKNFLLICSAWSLGLGCVSCLANHIHKDSGETILFIILSGCPARWILILIKFKICKCACSQNVTFFHRFQNCFCFRSMTFPSHVGTFFQLQWEFQWENDPNQ